MSSFVQTPVTLTLKNILYATDFSPCSEAALPYVRAIAERYGSTVHLVHVVIPQPAGEVPVTMIAEDFDAQKDNAEATMQTLLARKPFGNAATTTTVVQGALWKVLSAFMKDKSVDLIVVGTHGRRGLKKMVLGSVAEEVFRLARCPVLTVGPEVMHEATATVDFKTILFATDFESGSEHALPYAISLARANNSHLILLHAVLDTMEPPDLGLFGGPAEARVALARQRVADLVPADVVHELNPEIITEGGPAANTILNYAKSKQADLIVMGARHGVPSVAAHMPWATAYKVVCEAHCPTLTVRS